MRVRAVDSFDAWVRGARAALREGWDPASTEWLDLRDGQGTLLSMAEDPVGNGSEAGVFRVPRVFMERADEVGCHRSPRPWATLYRVLWRLTHGEPHLLEVAVDSDVRELQAMAKSVRHEVHKMRAFVRFRERATENGSWYVAWFEPRHDIVERNAAFFRDRFAGMRWSILTPDRCVHWDGQELEFTPGVDQSHAPADDQIEDLWRTYYRNIFNPARLKVQTMTGHMARRYWKNLPEAEAIPALVSEAPARVRKMRGASDAKTPETEFQPYEVPSTKRISVLAEAAQSCRGCPLWKNATCAVFGEGPSKARILVVGEQPGDQEDRAGKPFVGPAGQLLNRAFEAAGVDRSELYVTNAVKHFKWTPSGKRRLHAKPSPREIAACRPWLEAEIGIVKPDLIVCLGATAALTVAGKEVRVTQQRGEKVDTEWGIPALLTVHPSSLLRLPASADRDAEFARFVKDLKGVKGMRE
jgi:uracil-DNA glycosylase